MNAKATSSNVSTGCHYEPAHPYLRSTTVLLDNLCAGRHFQPAQFLLKNIILLDDKLSKRCCCFLTLPQMSEFTAKPLPDMSEGPHIPPKPPATTTKTEPFALMIEDRVQLHLARLHQKVSNGMWPR